MLSEAIKARLPLIHITTGDTINVQGILEYIAEEPVALYEGLASLSGCNVFYTMHPLDAGKYEPLYNLCVDKGKCVIFVNIDDPSPLFFQAGELLPPKEFVKQALEAAVHPDNLDHVLAALAGLSVKEVGEVVRLTSSRDGSITARGIMETRRMFINRLRGIQHVDTELDFYVAPPVLQEWLAVDGQFFVKGLHPKLTPRGLLFDGPPGTGKTMGAKHLASSMGLPLYRLDLGMLMGKYVGDSEHNLTAALNQVDQIAPCLLLMDEVEKLFQQKEDAGVTGRLLSQLLWWLQEHQTRVLTIMTTNDVDAIPAELYRPGRVDAVITFEGVHWEDAQDFATDVLMQFGTETYHAALQSVLDGLKALYGASPAERRSQAQITQLVYAEVKRALLTNA